MKNTLVDLNNHLFAQLERLGDESLNGDELTAEIERGTAITQVSKEVISNATLQLNAMKLHAEYNGLKKGELPKQLGIGNV